LWCNINPTAAYKVFFIISSYLGTVLRFIYENNDGVITAKGMVNEKELAMTMKQVSGGQPLLVSRGFHWVNEYPLNR
jgi:hypothetical protein